MYSSRRGVLGGTKSTTACITSLRVAGEIKIILADFKLVVSTLTAKTAKVFPVKFSSYRYCEHFDGPECIFV